VSGDGAQDGGSEDDGSDDKSDDQKTNEPARLIKIYKSQRKPDSYLYVDFSEDLSRVPETLLNQFGEPELTLSLSLNPSRKLAQADAGEVLSNIETNGYYLQMPPTDGGVDEVIRRAAK
jgi:uncharacterized protein YcgL (UPF0745 family)